MTHSRARRPVFGDIRFVIGIVLVIASVAGVWLLVSSSRQTAPVLQATRTIVLGEPISSDDLQVVDVGLGALTDTYLAPQDLAPGSIATRTLADGELVPRSAVGTTEQARTTTVVVSSTATPAGMSAGTVVEVWHAPLSKDGRSFEDPRILVGDAVVVKVAEADGMLAQTRTDVELAIDRGDVADVLAAITGGDAISLVPAGGGS
ncbi:SAF domain-containing protein [Microbacterium sp. H1-D42]|uniref:SAF domain-containing protein n=1 Tax=Microbacterium sp. H1-D42 TaxID=2925844 RepID=UPI001F5358D7|nr:SAF domain-containing protein [Microbacterium sp. H1-D42]UNK69682.1 SAF domain-containing protein [Microbacterium sp. H1-D42]